MRKFYCFLLSFFFGISNFCKAQSVENNLFSLNDCIDYAMKHNLTVKQSEIAAQNLSVVHEQSKYLQYPSLNGSYNANGNTGRNVDPFSNSIVTQTIGTNNLGIGFSLPIYNGLQNRNTIARNQLNAAAAEMDIQTQKNNITLQISLAYLNVLSTEDLIAVANSQLEVTVFQMDRTKKLISAGSLSETAIYDLESQKANDELNLVNAQNNHELAMLNLKQLMNAPSEMKLEVQRIVVSNPKILKYPESQGQIYSNAIGYLPEIKAGQIRLKAADRNIAIAKAFGHPTATLTSSWGSAYSSVAKKLTLTEPTFQQISAVADYNGQSVPLTLNFPQTNYDREKIPYFSQIKNNQNFNVGLSLRIPIFNGFNQKYQTQIAQIQKLNTENLNETTKLQIRQNIDQAYINMLNAEKKYLATEVQVNALEKSFEVAEKKFSAGAGTFVDYNLAKTNLDKAKSNLIAAKYDYIFRIKILDFYQNKPLDY